MRTVLSSVLVLTLALAVCSRAAWGWSPATPVSSDGYLTGKVTSGQSKPVSSVWVIVYDGAAPKGKSLTGDDGRYYIGRLEEKTYTVVVRKQASGSNLSSQSVSLPQDRVHNINLP